MSVFLPPGAGDCFFVYFRSFLHQFLRCFSDSFLFISHTLRPSQNTAHSDTKHTSSLFELHYKNDEKHVKKRVPKQHKFNRENGWKKHEKSVKKALQIDRKRGSLKKKALRRSRGPQFPPLGPPGSIFGPPRGPKMGSDSSPGPLKIQCFPSACL